MQFLLMAIDFPRLDPDALRLGSMHIRWYGIAYLLGFASAFGLLRRLARAGILRIPMAAVGDLVALLALAVVVGGRAGWWLFYHRGQGAVEPWYEPVAIWHGGMSFHGGLIGVLIALWVWSGKTRSPLLNLADCLAFVATPGLFFGRIANFINAELVGRPTNVPWGVIFPGESMPRHPSQLYEAILEGPVLLLFLLIARKMRSLKDGQLAAVFLIFYGLFRFLAEFTRQPDAQLGFIAFNILTMGQLLSAIAAMAGVLCFGRLQSAGQNPATRIAGSQCD